jgi:hypothetical protein
MAPNLFGKMFNKFYRFCSEPKTKFYFHLIYGILAIHLTVYAVALARYEFAVFSLDSKVANLTVLFEGKNSKSAFEKIPLLSNQTIPIEPKVYNILYSIGSLLPYFDRYNSEPHRELRDLIAHYKSELKGLDLSGLRFYSSQKDENVTNFITNFDFKNENRGFFKSNFIGVKLIAAVLDNNVFAYSSFYGVDFLLAKMSYADFAFVEFNNSRLLRATLKGSNLCGAEFTETSLDNLNLSNANLIGVDLSEALVFSPEMLTNLEGAYGKFKD